MLNTILLPYSNFRRSVACYSDFTLYQTLRLILAHRRCLTNAVHRVGWRERDTWIAWSKWQKAYIHLGMMCAAEATSRRIPYDHNKAARLFHGEYGEHWTKPLWVNWDRLHSQHRAALLHTGRVEGVANRITVWEGLEEATIDTQVDTASEWFHNNISGNICACDARVIDEAHNILTDCNAPTYYTPNHYEQFNWSEQPTGCIEAYPPEPEIPWICEA